MYTVGSRLIIALTVFVFSGVVSAQSVTEPADAQPVAEAVADGSMELATELAEGENSIWVPDISAGVGGTATATVKLTSDTDVHAVGLDLLFDQTLLQVKPLSGNSVTVGSDASGLDIPAMDDDLITMANSSGRLPIYMLHLNIDPEVTLNKIDAGADLEVLQVKFEVNAEAAPGEVTIGLTNVDLVNIADDDTTTVAVAVTSTDGTLTISEFATGDASGDGKVDIFDVLAVLKALSGTASVGPSDVNGDGKTNIFDVLAVLGLLKN